MIFNEICNNIIEIGVLEFQNEMASFNDYSLYTSYLTEATASTDNKKKNIISRAFDAIKRMFDKLIEKIQSLFNRNKTASIDKAINNLKKTNKGKDALSKKRDFKVFKNTKKLDTETAQRLMKAKSVDEIERIMSSYRKQRNSTIKVVSVAIGSVVAISAAKYIHDINRYVDYVEKCRSESNRQMIKYRSELFHTNNYSDSLKKEYNELEKKYNSLKNNDVPKLSEELNRMSGELKGKNKDISKLNKKISELDESRENIIRSRIERDKEIKDLKDKIHQNKDKDIEQSKIIHALTNSLCEIYSNLAKTIKEEVNQQYTFYNNIMKVSNVDTDRKVLLNAINNIGDVEKMGMREVSDAMNKVNELMRGLKPDQPLDIAKLNEVREALKKRVIELNTKSK